MYPCISHIFILFNHESNASLLWPNLISLWNCNDRKLHQKTALILNLRCKHFVVPTVSDPAHVPLRPGPGSGHQRGSAALRQGALLRDRRLHHDRVQGDQGHRHAASQVGVRASASVGLARTRDDSLSLEQEMTSFSRTLQWGLLLPR